MTPFTRRVNHKRSLLKKLVVQSAVSKYIHRKLSGRKKCGRKRCISKRDNRSLERIVRQNPFKNLGELHKEWTEAGVKSHYAQMNPRHGLQMLYSSCQATAEPETTSEASYLGSGEKELDLCSDGFHYL